MFNFLFQDRNKEIQSLAEVICVRYGKGESIEIGY